MELAPDYKPSPRHLAAALLLALAALVAAAALLWPALQTRAHLAEALAAAADSAAPGTLLILYADAPPTPPPDPALAWIALDPQAPPPDLSPWGRLLLVREGADPPHQDLDVLERRLYGQARLWLARPRAPRALLAAAAPDAVSLTRGGQRWPCDPDPDGWRCPRAGGHLAIATQPACWRAQPWDRGALRLEGRAPDGATALLLTWALDGDQPAALRAEPGAQPWTLSPGQGRRWLPLTPDRAWAFELPAAQSAAPCLALSAWGPWRPPDPDRWRDRLQRAHDLRAQGATAQAILDAFYLPLPLPRPGLPPGPPPPQSGGGRRGR
jgi:hypothetical protein